MQYNIIKTWRKTLAIQIKNGEIIVRSPKLMPTFVVDNFIKKNKIWIENKLKQSVNNKHKNKISEEDILKLKAEAKNYIPNRVQYLAEVHNVEYNNIKITSAKTRWGSCTSKKNINFSYRLIKAEKKAIDYVIIHEFAHLKFMNHSKEFWNHVGEMMPDYKYWDNWFKKEGRKIN